MGKYRNTARCRSRLCWLVLAAMLLSSPLQAQPSAISINGVQLSLQQVYAYQIDLPPGRYWYDRVSGLWGQEGGPSVGQIAANLDLGGQLQANASASTTGVFINGRQIHPMEVVQLQQYFQSPIMQGRYWLQWDGTGGVEGGPASFKIEAAVVEAQPDGSGQVFEDEVADFCAQVGGCPW
jgi:hypothetical protein